MDGKSLLDFAQTYGEINFYTSKKGVIAISEILFQIYIAVIWHFLSYCEIFRFPLRKLSSSEMDLVMNICDSQYPKLALLFLIRSHQFIKDLEQKSLCIVILGYTIIELTQGFSDVSKDVDVEVNEVTMPAKYQNNIESLSTLPFCGYCDNPFW